MNIVLLMMGGSGTRVGTSIPKQYLKINNIPIFAYILNKYQQIEEIDKIVVVSNSNYIDLVNTWINVLNINKVYEVCSGGRNRSESVLNGLEVAKKIDENATILIHDATHPYVDTKGVKKLITTINKYGAATLVQGNYDTVYEIENSTITKVLERKNVVSGASPEGFKFKEIYNIYKNATIEELEKMTSAGAIAIANGLEMKTIETDLLNLKITFKRDIELFKKLINSYYFKDEDDQFEK